MTKIYTLTLAPSLDSATLTPQMYPEGKLRCSAPIFEPGGGGINVARAITFLGGKATAISRRWRHRRTPYGAAHRRTGSR
jgi:6-phosphofructokinase 2